MDNRKVTIRLNSEQFALLKLVQERSGKSMQQLLGDQVNEMIRHHFAPRYATSDGSNRPERRILNGSLITERV